MKTAHDSGPRGLIAEFAAAEPLIGAIRRLRAEGYTRLEAYAPFAVEGLADELPGVKSPVRPIMLVSFVAGAAAGLGMQLWTAAVAYPINSGGRPLASWGAFIPVTFEIGILFASIAGFIAFLVSAGLPKPHHPMFDAHRFERVTDDGFLLEVRGGDPKFDAHVTRSLLAKLGAAAVEEAPR